MQFDMVTMVGGIIIGVLVMFVFAEFVGAFRK